MPDEWVEWHQAYPTDAARVWRLEVVQESLRVALDRCPPGPIRLISLCAGDGRDLLGVLPGHPRAPDVRARLVEIHPDLARAAREAADRLHLPGVEVVEGDASTTDVYAGAVPADIVQVCGVFGNISDADIRTTIHHLPELCAKGAQVIWTRGRFEPDVIPSLRAWFREAGFHEVAFLAIPTTTATVGVHRLTAAPRPFRPGVHLFTFLPKSERPSRRGQDAAATTGVPRPAAPS